MMTVTRRIEGEPNVSLARVRQYYEHPTCYVIGGALYSVGRENAYVANKGYSGRRFVIRPVNGRPEVVTTNLNFMAYLPTDKRLDFPDTAEFVGPSPPTG